MIAVRIVKIFFGWIVARLDPEGIRIPQSWRGLVSYRDRRLDVCATKVVHFTAVSWRLTSKRRIFPARDGHRLTHCCGGWEVSTMTQCYQISLAVLTHWGQDEMGISQTTFSNVFPSMEMCKFRLKCHWSLFLRVELYTPALVQIMVWCRPGDKPLSEPVMVNLPTHICVTRPQWVKWTIAWSDCFHPTNNIPKIPDSISMVSAFYLQPIHNLNYVVFVLIVFLVSVKL